MMRTIAWGGVFVGLAGALCACGEPGPQRRADPAADPAAATPDPPAASAFESPSLPPPSLLNTTVEKPPVESGPEYIAYGVCPYNCCRRVGTWKMARGGNVRVQPTFLSDVVWVVADSELIRYDNAIMITRPTGLAVIAGENSSLTQQLSGPRPGDTLEILTYVGNGISRVRWHGQEFETITNQGGTPISSLQMVREPGHHWWVHVTDSTSQRPGWMHMGGMGTVVNAGADACGR